MASDPDRARHREHLVSAGENASRDFDKAVFALSGGALGISIAFVRDLVPNPVHIGLLGLAWALLALSLTATFASTLTSQWAIRRAIADLDRDKEWRRSGFGWVTVSLNGGAAALFVLGAGCLIWFAWVNLKGVAG